MDNDYSWTKFNPAAARKLCAYSNRREELLSWLYSALPEETAPITKSSRTLILSLFSA